MRTLDYRPLADLVPHEGNPKAHDTDLINDSVGRFGFVEPIILDERTGKIISGHGRTSTLRTMEQRGDDPPDGVKIDNGQWLAPVITGWASRSDAEADAALVALNRAGEVGGWDDPALIEILESLAEGPGLEGVGFNMADLDKLKPPDDLDPEPGLSGDLEYRVVIDCRDEAQQADLLDRFDQEGLTARPLTS